MAALSPAEEKKSEPGHLPDDKPDKKAEKAPAPAFNDDDDGLDIIEDDHDSDSGTEGLANLRGDKGQRGGTERPKTATGGQIKFIDAEEYADYLEKYESNAESKHSMRSKSLLYSRLIRF